MFSVKKEFNKKQGKIKNGFRYEFNVPSKSLYLIEILASAKSWVQNLTSLRGFFNDDDLTVLLDGREFPKQNGKRGLFDGEVAWNGNSLKGLTKTNVFIMQLEKGEHFLEFLTDNKPVLERIKVEQLAQNQDLTRIQEIQYHMEEDNPAEDGNRRPWLTIVLIDSALKSLQIRANVNKYPGTGEDDDLKLIIDGEVQENFRSKAHKKWLWCGRSAEGESEVMLTPDLAQSVHYVEFWADKMPELKLINLKIGEFKSINETDTTENIQDDYKNRDKEWWLRWKELRKYTSKGFRNNEDYNRYDDLIRDVVAIWNHEFFSQGLPPDEPLDPNLVKAIIYWETRVGHDARNNGKVNVMQVGNSGDPSLDVLNGAGENPEYELIDGKLWKVDYKGKAKVENVFDSIYWGVRWLYHRAQEIGNDGDKKWHSWRNAVKRYGPGEIEYANSVWQIYTEGIDSRDKLKLKLWILLGLIMATSMIFSFVDHKQRIKTAIRATFSPKEEVYVQDIELKSYWKEPALFATVIVTYEDWSEELKIGRFKDNKISWLEMKNPPQTQSILSFRFIDLENFNNPLLEVYGWTHAGHGGIFVYEIKDNQLELLLDSPAVDTNSDIRWAPDNNSKYGYGNCGEIFKNDKLNVSYEDLNSDGTPDVILSGKKEIICDDDRSSSASSKWAELVEIKVAEETVRKVFLWNEGQGKYVEQGKDFISSL